MIVTAINIRKINGDNSLVAVANVTFNNSLVLERIKLIEKNGVVFFAMPSTKTPNGSYKDVVFPVNQIIRSSLERILIPAYNQLVAAENNSIYFHISSDKVNELTNQKISDFSCSECFIDNRNDCIVENFSITELKIRRIENPKMIASIDMTMDSEIVIRNIRLIKTNITKFVSMPSYQTKQNEYKNIIFPIDPKTRQKIEFSIISAYNKLVANDIYSAICTIAKEDIEVTEMQYRAADKPKYSVVSQTEFASVEDAKKVIFSLLWNASDNGYILQSNVVPILNKHGIGWKELFRVETLKELVEKLDFLKIRKLEPKPNSYVNWIVVSTQKTVMPVSEVTSDTSLPENTMFELHQVLFESTKSSNGEMLMSEVIPAIQRQRSDILPLLSNMKLLNVLKMYPFIKLYTIQSDDIHVQNWIRVDPIDGACIDFELERSDSNSISAEIHTDEVAVDKLLPQKIIKKVSSPDKDLRGKVIVAQHNPFQYVPDTRFWPEHRVIKNTPLIRVLSTYGKNLTLAFQRGTIGQHELDVLSWISKLLYVKNTMIVDLIQGGYIQKSSNFTFTLSKIGDNLARMFKYNLVDVYRFCSVNSKEEIESSSIHRIFTITNFGHNNLRDIGRESDFNAFVVLQDANTIKQRLSMNQWFIKWITIFSEITNRFLLNKVLVAKIPSMFGARINAIVECNAQPIFAQSVRRGDDWKHAIKSGEFLNKFQRVINIITNYNNLYYDNQPAEFIKKPVYVFIGEDTEHCWEIFAYIKKFVYPNQIEPIINVWFCCDLEIYNNFLNSHFTFDINGEFCAVNIFDALIISELPDLFRERESNTNETLEEYDMQS